MEPDEEIIGSKSAVLCARIFEQLKARYGHTLHFTLIADSEEARISARATMEVGASEQTPEWIRQAMAFAQGFREGFGAK
jgi:hypothetical protein